nr:phosphoribosylglycinamide formyltransferase [Bacteroidia bacterium]
EAVLANKEKTSGVTVHYVNEVYDQGEIILQTSCALSENETLDSLSAKIRQLEFESLPKAIEKFL